MTKPNSFQRLELVFDHCENMTDNSLLDISEVIVRGMKSLKHLRLEFRFGCGKNITDFSIRALKKSLKVKITTLRTIDLNFGGSNKITNAAVVGLCKTVYAGRSNLIEVKLNFDGCEKN